MLSIRNLSFGYGDSFHLENITFEVPAAGFFGIIGPNGSGKSTLLKVINKVLQPESGEVLLKGTSVRHLSLPDLARQMATVGSEAQFTFPFRVVDVVAMGRLPFVGRLGAYQSGDHEAVDAALRKTETWEFRERYIHELSSGERQRVLLARALAQQPQVLLLDEPTAHLDLHYEVEIFRILQNLNRSESLTMVAISHNLNLMAEFCHRLVLLENGRCRLIGSPEAILTPEILKDVFRIECQVEKNPFSGAPAVMLNTGSA